MQQHYLTLLGLFVTAAGAHAQQAGAVPALTYDAQTRGPVPIPPAERGLETVLAEPWFKVSDEGLVLGGPAFDREGNLLFCDVSGRRVFRLTTDQRLSTSVREDQLAPGGLAIHKDGRIFIAAMDIPKGIGSIVAVKPDGSGLQATVPPEAGYVPNDLVFDAGEWADGAGCSPLRAPLSPRSAEGLPYADANGLAAIDHHRVSRRKGALGRAQPQYR